MSSHPLPADRAWISIADLAALSRKGWIGFPVMLACALLAGIVFLAVTKPYYVVEMSVGPTEDNQAESPQSFLSSYVASFGLGGVPKNSEFATFLDVLTGPATSEIIVQKRPDLVREMFRERWDDKKLAWKKSSGFPLLGSGTSQFPPNYQVVSAFLQKNISQKDSSISLITRLRFETDRPYFGVALMGAIYSASEDVLRTDARISTVKQINYLRNRLQSRDITVEQRDALILLVGKAEKSLMLLSNDLPYAAHIVERAQLPQNPDGPSVIRVLLISLAGGLLAGFFASVALGSGIWRMVFQKRRRGA
jgi:hypothetical protein